MLRFAADENFNNNIIRGVLRRKPELDIVRIQDAGLGGADDPTVLEWAADTLSNSPATFPLCATSPRPYIARGAIGAERQQFWEMAVDVYPGYARRPAPRQIPVLVLSPA